MSPALGRPRRHLRRTSSTNDLARALAAGGAPHGTLVTADEQTAGRGRQGRTWTAPPGSSLLCSLVLRDPPWMTPLHAAAGVAEAVETTLRDAGRDDAVGVKWPNDIHVGGRKVAGILAE